MYDSRRNTEQPSTGVADILLVEDNPGDARLAMEAFREAGVRAQIHVAADGPQALAFLRQRAGADAPRLPDLVLLDINLPGMNGHEILGAIRADAALSELRVAMLTTSPAQEDETKARAQRAICYIAKPVELRHFIEVVRRLEGLWTSGGVLP